MNARRPLPLRQNSDVGAPILAQALVERYHLEGSRTGERCQVGVAPDFGRKRPSLRVRAIALQGLAVRPRKRFGDRSACDRTAAMLP
jgi:hypothetical protein